MLCTPQLPKKYLLWCSLSQAVYQSSCWEDKFRRLKCGQMQQQQPLFTLVVIGGLKIAKKKCKMVIISNQWFGVWYIKPYCASLLLIAVIVAKREKGRENGSDSSTPLPKPYQINTKRHVHYDLPWSINWAVIDWMLTTLICSCSSSDQSS